MIAVSWGEPKSRANELWPGVVNNMRAIIHRVAFAHGVSVDAIVGKGRGPIEVSRARQEAYWRCRQVSQASCSTIGRLFGKRDESTILAGIRAHERRMSEQVLRQSEALPLSPLSPDRPCPDESPSSL